MGKGKSIFKPQRKKQESPTRTRLEGRKQWLSLLNSSVMPGYFLSLGLPCILFPVPEQLSLNSPLQHQPPSICCFSSESEAIIHSVKPKGWTAHANREFRRPACLEPIFSRALGSSQLTAWWPLTGEQKREGKEQRFSACFQSIPEGNLHIRKGNAKRPLKQRGKTSSRRF